VIVRGRPGFSIFKLDEQRLRVSFRFGGHQRWHIVYSIHEANALIDLLATKALVQRINDGNYAKAWIFSDSLVKKVEAEHFFKKWEQGGQP
jgi:hypothetical protein